jgi:hypothetical protein
MAFSAFTTIARHAELFSTMSRPFFKRSSRKFTNLVSNAYTGRKARMRLA